MSPPKLNKGLKVMTPSSAPSVSISRINAAWDDREKVIIVNDTAAYRKFLTTRTKGCDGIAHVRNLNKTFISVTSGRVVQR